MRTALAVLLAAATALFAAGAIAERSQVQPSGESPAAHAQEQTETSGESGGAGETHTEALLGVDVESTPSIVLAVVVGLGVAALVASRFGRLRGVLIAAALLAIAWAALDVREVVHQLDESRSGIAVIAIAVAAMHVAAAPLAARIAAA